MARGAESRFARAAPAHRQRGVAAIFAALSLVTLLSALALAIDIGRLYTAQRSLQRLADLAAIDAARVRSQCLGAADFDAVTAEVLASLARNRAAADVVAGTTLGLRLSGADGLQYFQPVLPDAPADSVQVTLRRPSPARILPLFSGAESRRLTARAAAQGKARVFVPPPRIALPEATAEFANRIYGGQLGSAVSLSGGQFRASLDATVDGRTLLAGEARAGLPALPDISTPQPVQGLLNALLTALDDAGDTAAAAAVENFRDALTAGRGVVDVVPADLLGLPPGQTYDDVTIPVGNLLANIAATVTDGEPISFPVALPEPLGDGVRITVQPGRPGTADNFTPGASLDTSQSSDAAFASASLLRIEIALLNPVTGGRFTLPIASSFTPPAARASSLSCARLGQEGHRVSVLANGGEARFAIGQSDQVFTGAGLDALPPLTLFPLQLLGQTVRVTAQLDAVRLGNAQPQTLCFSGPPFGEAVQCDGAAATVGGADSRAAVDSVAAALQGLRLRVQLPANVPPLLAGPLQAQADSALALVNAEVRPALGLLAQQLVPLLQAVNLTIGAAEVRVGGVTVVQPRVYAQ